MSFKMPMPDTSKASLMAKHARLFELIRQRNVANQVQSRKARTHDSDPADIELFKLQAERSLKNTVHVGPTL